MAAALGGEVPADLSGELHEWEEDAVHDLGQGRQDQHQISEEDVGQEQRPGVERSEGRMGRQKAGDEHPREQDEHHDVLRLRQGAALLRHGPGDEDAGERRRGEEGQEVGPEGGQHRPGDRQVALPEEDVSREEERHDDDADVKRERGDRVERPRPEEPARHHPLQGRAADRGERQEPVSRSLPRAQEGVAGDADAVEKAKHADREGDAKERASREGDPGVHPSRPLRGFVGRRLLRAHGSGRLEGRQQEIVQPDDPDVLEAVVFADLAELLLAVGAGGHQHGRAGAADLLRLGLAADERPEGADLVDGDGPASAPAAVVLAAVRRHVDEVRADGAQDLARLVDHPARSGDVAGVVIRHALADRAGLQGQLPLPKRPQRVLHDVDHLGSVPAAAEGPDEELGRARGVPALADQDLARPEAADLRDLLHAGSGRASGRSRRGRS